MLKWIGGVLGTVVGGLLLAYATNLFGLGEALSGPAPGPGTGITGPTGTDGTGEPPKPRPVVMGSLEIGTNRQGNDFDAFGKPAGNAELCAEMCRAEASCDAMTYVKSSGICWMKNGVPAASADADMVSSVKVKPAG